MHRHFEELLEEVGERISRMAGLVEQAIGRSMSALMDRNTDLARRVIEDDAVIDAEELELDRLCMEILATQQVMASDLRYVTTAMKVNTDLERIGDHAANICERAIELNKEPELKPLIDLPAMAALAQTMVRDSLDAFIRRDAELARKVIRMDDALDDRMEDSFRQLMRSMLADPSAVGRALRLSFIAKYLERIGDQATNVCEQVVYMAEARVIKHPRLAERPDDADE